MEYSLNISQKAIHENFPTLDIKDAAIIDFLSRFSHSDSIQKRFYGGKVFYWFDYGKIADENPLVKLDKESIRRRIRNLCSLGIFIPHPENQGGRVFFAFGSEYEKTHKFEVEKKHRADLPELKKETSGRFARPHRAENPELLAKHRADLPDNHKDHSNHNNQSSSEPENDAADGLKIELHDPENPDFKVVDVLPLEAKKEKDTPSSAAPLEKEIPPPPAENRYAKRYDAFDIDIEASSLKSDMLCRDRFGRDLRIGLEKATTDFPEYVDEFVFDQKTSTFNYQNTKDFRSHFFNWILTAPKAKRAAMNAPKEGGPPRGGKASLTHLTGIMTGLPQKF